MANWTIRPAIADAILCGRILKLPTARAIYESQITRVSDELWSSLEPQWQWHFEQSQSDLEAATKRD